jgi:hypothetical protein
MNFRIIFFHLILGVVFLTSSKLNLTQSFPTEITEHSIGKINLCQNFRDIDLPIIRDTSYFGNGFEYIGKYFKEHNSEILTELNLVDSTTFIISTKSKQFKTVDNISVGSSINTLIEVKQDLKFEVIENEYQDVYFYEDFNNSRIEYRVSRTIEPLLFQFANNDGIEKVKDVQGMLDTLKLNGNSNYIRKISVVLTSHCNQ